MAQIETSVQIAAPAEIVFAFFVPQRMPYWYGAEMQSCLEMHSGAADFGHINNMGVNGGSQQNGDPGLTFDTGFAANYWIGVTIGPALRPRDLPSPHQSARVEPKD